jgi:GNAT superfamily N-acetyltransferase
MDATEADLVAERLSPVDADAALPLSTEAGWNQTAEDWRFMLSEGRGVGMRDSTARWIGSALALPLGERLSWISMVLVAKEARRRGIGTRLLRRAIEMAEESGQIAGLDATELGRPLYQGLRFRDLYPVSRLRLDEPRACATENEIGCALRRLTPVDLAATVAYDGPRSAMRRGSVLAYLLGRAPGTALVAEADSRIVGYALGRPGRHAFQIGPVVADNEAIACALVSKALSRLRGPALLDLPDAHAGLRASLDRVGAVRQRGFMRMALAETPAGLAEPGAVFALAGPELG